MRISLFLVFLLFFNISFSQTSEKIALPLQPPLQLTSNFAEYRSGRFHIGLDFRTYNKNDRRIFSVWDGYVSRVRFNSASYGRAVYITHPNGYTSVYGHLSSFSPEIDSLVTNYQNRNKTFEADIYLSQNTIKIKKGQAIGVAGNSGYSFGEHLHFEIRDTKTSDPLNPLMFFQTNDRRKPIFYQIGIYSLQSGGFLPANVNLYKVILQGETYTTTLKEISVPDTFFIGIDVQDFQSLSYRLLPRTIEVLIDNILVWKIDFSRYSFALDSNCKGIFDHNLGLNKKKQIVLTYSGNVPNTLFYKKISNRGLFTLKDSLPHKLTIIATDAESNSSTFNTTIIKNKKSSLHVNNKYKIFNHQFNTFNTEYISINLNINTFYSDMALEQPFLIEKKVDNELVWTIGSKELPIIKPFKITFNKNNFINSKTLLVQTDNSNKIIKSYKPSIDSGGKWFVKMNNTGDFKLFEDTVPPQIYKDNINSLNTTATNDIILYVSDNSGVIKSYNAYVDGVWQLMIYDFKYDQFTIPLKKNQKIKKLHVIFTDLVGNKTEKTFLL